MLSPRKTNTSGLAATIVSQIGCGLSCRQQEPKAMRETGWVREHAGRSGTRSSVLTVRKKRIVRKIASSLSLRERAGVRGRGSRQRLGTREAPHPNLLPEGEGTGRGD